MAKQMVSHLYKIVFLETVIACGGTDANQVQAATTSSCSWDEVQARSLELNAATPIQTQNSQYIIEYQTVISRQYPLILAAKIRDDLPRACSVLEQLEQNLEQVNRKYR